MDLLPEGVSKRKRTEDGGSDFCSDPVDPKKFKQQISASLRGKGLADDAEGGEDSVPKSAGIDDDRILSSVEVSSMEDKEKGGDGSDASNNKKKKKKKRRVMTKELWKKYWRQVKESEGFSVDEFPRSAGSILRPLRVPLDFPLTLMAAQCTIDWHNRKKKDGPIELVRVVKIIAMIGGWTHLFMTFEGRDMAGGPPKTYQAKVLSVTARGFACCMFRLKPTDGTRMDEFIKRQLDPYCVACFKDQESESDSDIPADREPKTDCDQKSDSDPEEESTIDEEVEDEYSESDDGEEEEELDDGEDNDDELDDGEANDDDDQGVDQENEEVDHNDNSSNHPEEEDDSHGQSGGDYQATGGGDQADSGDNQDYDGLFEGDDIDTIGDEKTFTLEHIEAYYEQLQDSKGFDIEYFPEMETLCFITPLPAPYDDSIAKLADFAVDFLNKEGAKYKLVKILKANWQTFSCCSHVYITFDVKEGDDGECKTFQSRILSTPGREKVEEIRLKPLKS